MASSTSAQQAALAVNPQFQLRIKAEMVASAAAIIMQTISSPLVDAGTYALRQALASRILGGDYSTLTAFSWAAATSAAIIADFALPVAIASSAPGLPVTVTTVTVHGLTSGNIVEIDGQVTNTGINGTWTATVTSTTTFTIPVLGTVSGPQEGTCTMQPPDSDMNGVIGYVWSGVSGANGLT